MKKLEPTEVVEILKNDFSIDMIDYFIKNYDYFRLSSGGVLEFIKRPTITNQFWYDDEKEPPVITLNYFISYNIDTNFKNEIGRFENSKDNLKPYFIKRRYKNDELLALVTGKYLADYDEKLGYNQRKGYFKKYATQEDLKEIEALINELKEKYIKRLKTYFKKYNDKIYASGYWVNR